MKDWKRSHGKEIGLEELQNWYSYQIVPYGNVNKEADAQHQFNQDKLEEALIEINEYKTLDNQGQKD